MLIYMQTIDNFPLTSFLRYCKDTTKVVILVTMGMPGQRNDSINLYLDNIKVYLYAEINFISFLRYPEDVANLFF